MGDDARDLDTLEEWLSELPVAIRRARGGREALAVLAEDAPDLLLVEIVMQDVDGFEVLSRARATDALVPIAVVLMAPGSEPDHRRRGSALGADDCFDKPLDRALVVARATALLRAKAASDALAARNRALEERQKKQGELIELAVHDFKSPLTAIEMNLSFARSHVEPEDGELHDVMNDLARATQALRGMVEDLLIVTRSEDGSLALRPSELDLGDLVATVCAERSDVAKQVGVELAPSTQRALLTADAPLLRRMVCNLVDHALRRVERKGRVAVTVELERGENKVCVRYTGKPLSHEERAQMFERFDRETTRAGGHPKAGVGLYCARIVAEAHKGNVAAVEEDDWPVTIVARLPRT